MGISQQFELGVIGSHIGASPLAVNIESIANKSLPFNATDTWGIASGSLDSLDVSLGMTLVILCEADSATTNDTYISARDTDASPWLWIRTNTSTSVHSFRDDAFNSQTISNNLENKTDANGFCLLAIGGNDDGGTAFCMGSNSDDYDEAAWSGVDFTLTEGFSYLALATSTTSGNELVATKVVQCGVINKRLNRDELRQLYRSGRGCDWRFTHTLYRYYRMFEIDSGIVPDRNNAGLAPVDMEIQGLTVSDLNSLIPSGR